MNDTDYERFTRLNNRVKKALSIAPAGMNDGGWHKMWVIDQMVRALTGEHYEEWVASVEDGEDGPKTYEWDQGIPP
jgi:hypothetical protein